MKKKIIYHCINPNALLSKSVKKKIIAIKMNLSYFNF